MTNKIYPKIEQEYYDWAGCTATCVIFFVIVMTIFFLIEFFWMALIIFILFLIWMYLLLTPKEDWIDEKVAFYTKMASS